MLDEEPEKGSSEARNGVNERARKIRAAYSDAGSSRVPETGALPAHPGPWKKHYLQTLVVIHEAGLSICCSVASPAVLLLHIRLIFLSGKLLTPTACCRDAKKTEPK
jgi:hypothetical protein